MHISLDLGGPTTYPIGSTDCNYGTTILIPENTAMRQISGTSLNIRRWSANGRALSFQKQTLCLTNFTESDQIAVNCTLLNSAGHLGSGKVAVNTRGSKSKYAANTKLGWQIVAVLHKEAS